MRSTLVIAGSTLVIAGPDRQPEYVEAVYDAYGHKAGDIDEGYVNMKKTITNKFGGNPLTYNIMKDNELASEIISLCVETAYAADNIVELLRNHYLVPESVIQIAYESYTRRNGPDTPGAGRDDSSERGSNQLGNSDEGGSGQAGETGKEVPGQNESGASGSATEAVNQEEANSTILRFREETDPDVLKRLEEGAKLKVYRAMQLTGILF